jgi:flagellar hook-length control protein FliK
LDVKRDTRADGNENFLSTFKKVTQKQNPTTESHHSDLVSEAGGAMPDSVTNSNKTADPLPCPHHHCQERVPERLNEKTPNGDADRIISDKNSAFVDALENIGLHNWGREGNILNNNELDGATKVCDALPTPDMMSLEYEQSDVEPADSLLAKLQHLRQMIAKTLADIVASPAFGDLADGLGSNQLMEISEFNQSVKGVDAGKTFSGDAFALNFGDLTARMVLIELMGTSDFDQFAKNIYAAKIFAGDNSSLAAADSVSGGESNQLQEYSKFDHLIKNFPAGDEALKQYLGIHTWERSSAEKTLSTISDLIHLDSKLAEKVKEILSTKNSDNPEHLSQLQSQEKHPPSKLAAENQTALFVSSDNRSKVGSIEVAALSISDGDDESDTKDGFRFDYRANTGGRISAATEQKPSYSNESASEKLPMNESSPVSKLIEDALAAKEKQIKMNVSSVDESGSKVSKIDVTTGDNGLLNSQSQTADKAVTTAFPSKAPEADQGSLRYQTLDQIVRKAVIHLRNGQHEAKIDLKPDFLGHVRMQVITENQQVIVKILAELPFVKDMIENNVHQLKADLQQQGLTVDKLEVSVSHDSEENRNSKDDPGRLNSNQRNDASNDRKNKKEETQDQPGQSTVTAGSTSTVDFFA